MFLPFFYFMRERGLSPSIAQWISLLHALDKGLADSSLMEFYRLCRCLLLTSEADFDLFDEVFLDYFKASQNRIRVDDTIPEDVEGWLIPSHLISDEIFFSPEHMEILRRLEAAILRLIERFDEALAEGNIMPGSCEFCTGCGLCFRSRAETMKGVVMYEDDEPREKTVFEVAEERSFKDFREDKILDTRQFGTAFRRLRQYSSVSGLPETEFDVDRTIEKTADQAGMLQIVYGKPRKNAIKLMVLFDSDGSMWQHAEVSNRLFQAANRANHFKDLKFYYFHNCIYDHLYTSPTCINGEWESTEQVMRDYGGEYRVIYIGDASMADSELYSVGGNVLLERSNRLSGLTWLGRLRRQYARSVWLNPIMKAEWTRLYGGRTIQEVRRIFPMYELTVQGLNAAVKKLLVSR